MKRDLFTEICEEYKTNDSKLACVKFIKDATNCGLKRAKCEIADPFFDGVILDPYDLLTEEEKLIVRKFKRKRKPKNNE